MNIRNTCPDIPDSWRGGISDVARILGGDRPVSRETVKKYIRLGTIRALVSPSNRLVITGKEVKRLWKHLM